MSGAPPTNSCNPTEQKAPGRPRVVRTAPRWHGRPSDAFATQQRTKGTMSIERQVTDPGNMANQAPKKPLVNDTVGIIVHGDNTHITIMQSHTKAAPTMLTGTNNTAIGSQTADNSATTIGSQTAGNHSVITSRNDATDAKPARTTGGWWTRLRKRGVLVALFTIAGGIASLGALWITADWPTPW